MVLTSLNVHRILITSVLISTKVFDDEFYKNAYYAKLGGVSTSEMNSLELEFLSLVNFNLFVSTETFEKYQNELGNFVSASSPSVHSNLSVNVSQQHLLVSSSDQISPIDSFARDPPFLDDGQRQLDNTLSSLGCQSSDTSSFFFADYTPVAIESSGGGCMQAVSSDGFDCCGAGLEYHAGDSFGGHVMGHPPPALVHHNSVPLHHYPSKQQSYGIVGHHNVDQLPNQWPPAMGLGYTHSHQSYPPMHSHGPVYELNTDQPYYPPVSHGHGYGHSGYAAMIPQSCAVQPGHAYYPPTTTTPTSIADTFSYPSRLPSPGPYYDPGGFATPYHSPHMFQQQHQQQFPLHARGGGLSGHQFFHPPSPCDTTQQQRPAVHRPQKTQGVMFPSSDGRSPPRGNPSHTIALTVRSG